LPVRRAAAVIALAALFGVAASPAQADAAAPAFGDGQDALVVIASVTEVVQSLDDVVAVTGSVTNTGTAPLFGDINLRIANAPFQDADQIVAWEDAGVEEYDAWRVVAEVIPADAAIQPGESRQYRLEAPAEAFGFANWDGYPWGPWGVLVDIETATRSLAVARTYVVYAPPQATGPAMQVSAVVPLTSKPGETPEAAAGRATALVLATAGLAVDWVVDPKLIDPAAAGQNGAALAAAIDRQAGSRTVYALPYGDPDLAAIAHASGSPTTLITLARSLGRAAVRDNLPGIGGDVVHTLQWPQGTVDEAVLTLVDAVKEGQTILGSPAVAQRSTPAAPLAAVAPAARQVRLTASGVWAYGIVPDGDLAETVFGQPDAGSSEALSQQALRAELAWRAMEAQQGASAGAVVLVQRGSSMTPEFIASRLGFLLSLPWVRPVSLGALPASGRQTEVPLAEATAPGRGPGSALIKDLGDAVRRVRAFAKVTEDPAAVLNTMLPALVEPVCLAVDGTERARELAETALEAVRVMVNQVSVVHGSSVNMISSAGELPVTVHNGWDGTVTVQVELHPDHPSLVATEPAVLTIPAEANATAYLPVQAVANGTVTVEVVLANADGDRIAQLATFNVRVHAEWENIGTGIFGGLVAVLFLVGLVRAIRRRYRTRAAGETA
jgi:hypothetical protein